MERIAKAGAGFRSITENIDTTTPAGRMMMQMVGAFAEFERARIRERTSAGLAAARGRSSMPPSDTRSPRASSLAANPVPRMARLYNVSPSTVSRRVVTP
jgi:DNA invertase Pin-like site-specific DNA recombinase